jgi:glycosyltransferase involved in cell wall biosynthesis
MYKGKKVGAIIIAYNAERTLADTVNLVPRDIVDYLIICDDGSTDRTREIGQLLGVATFSHDQNLGAGANTRRGFDIMLKKGDMDIVLLLHGDNQYDPTKIPDVIDPIANGTCDMVLGRRIKWREGKMPFYKRIGNSFLTGIQNFVFKKQLADYATGYKAFTIDVLKTINYRENKSNFEFDPQVNVQAIMHGFRIMNVDVPTKYFAEASSVTFTKSVLYGFQTLKATISYFLYKHGVRTKSLETLFKKANNAG